MNWYFGNKAAINFNTVPPTVMTNSAMNTYNSSLTVSDPLTGKLLFYSNGNSFWNAAGEMIDSSVKGAAVQDAIAIPLKAYKNRYMVFNQSRVFVVDMQARGGRGSIILNQPFVVQNSLNRITAVKHCLSESYWLISIKDKNFYAYLVHPNGQIDAPVISYNAGIRYTNYLGDFVSSTDGNYLGITVYSPNGTDYIEPQVFKFDKRCGVVANEVIVLPMPLGYDRPHGIAFSPDTKLVYVAYGFQESQLQQYNIFNPADNVLIATSPDNFNQIAPGPDGKIYITTHIGNVPSNKMDVVHFPNMKGSACQYQGDYLRLKGNTNFEVPNMVLNHTGTCPSNQGFTLKADTALCAGQTVLFQLKGDATGIDDLEWFFADPSNPTASSKALSTQYVYTATGLYKPYVVMKACQKIDTFFFDVEVSKRENVNLGRDTSICHGDSILLGDANYLGPYQWSTGQTSAIIWAKKADTYHLRLMHKGCISSDTIAIAYHPKLKTLLGDQYYICEEEKELLVLDAGKGFKKYLWLPSNDSTQWIEVRRVGNYFVVVDDYRGCKGKDEAQVDDRCNLRVFIPNAFTPNGDGLNDRLHIYVEHEVSYETTIYNAWGELVFKGTSEQEWDGTYKGKKAPQGVYLIKVNISGFLNKLGVEQTYQGTLHLIY